MSDYKIPDLPSDEELGITKKDRENYAADDKPEMSDKEMAALLGEAPRAPAPPPKASKGPSTPPPPKAQPAKEPKKKAEPRPQADEGPRSRWGGVAMLAALLVGSWLTSSYRTLPSPVPANAPDTAFSSARAMAHLVEIARRPHAPGSPAHAQVRGYLLERLRDLGLDPKVETATSTLGRAEIVRAATVRNLVARIPGTASSGTVVLTAHYDGREIARAAGDAGFGVVAILETVRALKAGTPPKNDILVLITDGEELGLLGARAFVRDNPAMSDVKAVVSLEMRGGGGPSIMFEAGAENGWIVRALAASGARPFTNSLSYEVYKRLPNDTDFTPFREAGKQGLNFAGIGRASLYHQSYDSPENVSEATLQHHGVNALAVARYLGATPLAEVNGPDATFFTVPILGLVIYDRDLALPLAAAVFVLALVVLLPVRRASGRWAGVFVGLLLALVAVALTAASGAALMRWLPRFHAEFGSLHGSAFHTEGWYVAALVAAGLVLVTTLFGVARRRFGSAELTWGALLVPLGAMAYVSFAYPSAAASLQWPLAAALLATAISAVPARGWTSAVVWALLLALAVPVLALMVPLVEFLWLGLSFRAAPLIGALATVVLLLLLPSLDRLGEPNAWWAPLTALALGGACLGIGIGMARPDPRGPAPSTLVYLLDHGSGEALWATDTSDEPVDSVARAWVAQHAGAAPSATRSLAEFGYGARDARVVPAPARNVRAPEAWALSDSTWGGTRHLRLAVRSSVGAELIQFFFPEGSTTRLKAINGQALPDTAHIKRADHWGEPDPVVFLELQMPEGAALQMDVVEHLLRPAEVVGSEPFERPAELAPDITWMSDRAIFRTPSASLYVIPGPPPFPLEPGTQVPAAAAGGVPGEPPAVAADSLAADTLAYDSIRRDTIPGRSR
jgi:hypothetical protein